MLSHSSVLEVTKGRKWPGDEASACVCVFVGVDVCGCIYATGFAKRDYIPHFEMRVLQRHVFPQ